VEVTEAAADTLAAAVDATEAAADTLAAAVDVLATAVDALAAGDWTAPQPARSKATVAMSITVERRWVLFDTGRISKTMNLMTMLVLSTLAAGDSLLVWVSGAAAA
jgi:hypothetical protein